MFLIKLAEATNNEEWKQIEYNFKVSKQSQEIAADVLSEAFERWNQVDDNDKI